MRWFLILFLLILTGCNAFEPQDDLQNVWVGLKEKCSDNTLLVGVRNNNRQPIAVVVVINFRKVYSAKIDPRERVEFEYEAVEVLGTTVFSVSWLGEEEATDFRIVYNLEGNCPTPTPFLINGDIP